MSDADKACTRQLASNRSRSNWYATSAAVSSQTVTAQCPARDCWSRGITRSPAEDASSAPRLHTWAGLPAGDHARRDRGVGHRIDQNETSGRAIAAVRIAKDWFLRFDHHGADIVQAQPGCRFFFERVDIDAIAHGVHRRAHSLGGVLEQIIRPISNLRSCIHTKRASSRRAARGG